MHLPHATRSVVLAQGAHPFSSIPTDHRRGLAPVNPTAGGAPAAARIPVSSLPAPRGGPPPGAPFPPPPPPPPPRPAGGAGPPGRGQSVPPEEWRVPALQLPVPAPVRRPPRGGPRAGGRRRVRVRPAGRRPEHL